MISSIPNNVNATAFGSAKASNTIKKVATKLIEPMHTMQVNSKALDNTKVLILPTCITHVKKGGVAYKILSFFSKSFREQ